MIDGSIKYHLAEWAHGFGLALEAARSVCSLAVVYVTGASPKSLWARMSNWQRALALVLMVGGAGSWIFLAGMQARDTMDHWTEGTEVAFATHDQLGRHLDRVPAMAARMDSTWHRVMTNTLTVARLDSAVADLNILIRELVIYRCMEAGTESYRQCEARWRERSSP